jgi:hypothetical protein
VINATKEEAAKKRGTAKERTIDEQFPLDRADRTGPDRTGKTASGILSVKMTRTNKRFAPLRARVYLTDLFTECWSGLPTPNSNTFPTGLRHSRPT